MWLDPVSYTHLMSCFRARSSLVMVRVMRLTAGSLVAETDVYKRQAQYLRHAKSRGFITSGGLGMLDGMLTLLPAAKVGFIDVYKRQTRQVFVLDKDKTLQRELLLLKVASDVHLSLIHI